MIDDLANHQVVLSAVAGEREARAAGQRSLAAHEESVAAQEAEVHRQIDNLLPAVAMGGAVAESVRARLEHLNREAARLEAKRAPLAKGGFAHDAHYFADAATQFKAL